MNPLTRRRLLTGGLGLLGTGAFLVMRRRQAS